jgi:hypothetical protein
MKRIHGGEPAAPGFYWSTTRWAIATVGEREAPLPGPANEAYVRIPTVAMLAAGPVMGGLFAVFLPFLGFAMVVRELVRGASRLGGGRPRPRPVERPAAGSLPKAA